MKRFSSIPIRDTFSISFRWLARIGRAASHEHVWWLAAFVVVFLSRGTPAQEVLTGNHYAHDPSTIIKDGSRYYFFRTDYGISINWSYDLHTWNFLGDRVFPSGPPSWTTNDVPGFTGFFWAPDVVYFNGEYRLYYSCYSPLYNQDAAIGLVTSSSLSSPNWVDQGPVIQSNPGSDYNCIDPSILVETNGNVWMTFGSYWGGIYLVQLDPTTGLRIAPDSPTTQLAWNSSIEASYLYRRGSYYYLFVNHGSCCNGVNSTYNIRVGRSISITGPYLDRGGKSLLSGGGTLLLDDVGAQIGPGHAGIFSESGIDWFSYHYYDGNENGNAKLGLRQLQWTPDGWPDLGEVFPPDLTLDRMYLVPVCNVGTNAPSDQIEVWNRGGDTLNYTVSDNVSWLNCTPTNGSSTGEVDTITVNYSTSTLTAGTYTATINVTAGEGTLDSPQNLPVTLQVGFVASKPSVLKHRWSFNETSGAIVTDSVGGAHGTVMGTQYVWTGTELSLTNSGSAVQSSGAAETDPSLSYVDLPNGIFSALSNAVTFELWYTYDGGAGAPWQRTLDIGIADTGIENDVHYGSANLFMTCETDADVIRWAAATNAPGFLNGFVVGDIEGASALAGLEHHMVLTYDSDDGYAYLYLDGVLEDIRTVHWALSNLPDVNNWIGRSQYEFDPLLNGSMNELRVYNGVMTPAEVAAHLAAGPDSSIANAPLSIMTNGDGTITVAWPLWASGSVLESSPVLGPLASWDSVTGMPVEVEDFLQINDQADQTNGFYRLHQ